MCKVRPWAGLLLMLLFLSSREHWSTTCWLLSCFLWVSQPASQPVMEQPRGSVRKVSRSLSVSFSLHPSSWWLRGQCAGPPSGALGRWSLWRGWRWPRLWTGCLWRERSGTLLAPPRWPWSSCRSPVCPAARWSRGGSCLTGGPSEGWQTGQIKSETKGLPFSPLQVFVGRKIWFIYAHCVE